MSDSQQPPANLAAVERAVIGEQLRSPGAVEVVSSLIGSGDFADPRHELIQARIIAAYLDDRPTGPIAIAEDLGRAGELVKLDGGTAYLAACLEAAHEVTDVRHYAQIVKDAKRDRSITEALTRISVAQSTGNRERVAELAAELADLAAGRAGTESAPTSLEFVSLAELSARVERAGPRRWLLRGFWPAGEYGVHAAEMKAQKTWNTVDLAVSVASGTPWLGVVEVDDPGPVLMFAGEGSESNLVRRIRAVCTARDVTPADLPIWICTRAPHLTSAVHLAELQSRVEVVRPRLVTLDPLYLAARGATASSLYEMGAVLEGPQHICQRAGAALWVVTHFNRKEGRGAGRITGAGPAEWGRILISGTVISRHTDPDTLESTVVTELDVIGGEVADQALRIVRRIRAAKPDDLDSPLEYSVAIDRTDTEQPQSGEKLKPAESKLLDALRKFDGAPRTVAQLVDEVVAQHGHGLRRETVSRALRELTRFGLADQIPAEGVGKPALWFLPEGARDAA